MTKAQLKKFYQKEIKKIIEALKAYRPEKIILFGSAAKGDYREGSNLDLLVIKKTKEDYWSRQKKAALIYNGPLATDIFVLTPEEFEKAKGENRFFLTEEVLPKGKVVYEKENH